MEYVSGGDLRKQIKDQMEYGQIANFAIQALSALAFVHCQNVMHRDHEPENIRFAGPNRWKLGDLGLFREGAASASRQGTYFYMAPEMDGSSLCGWPLVCNRRRFHRLLCKRKAKARQLILI